MRKMGYLALLTALCLCGSCVPDAVAEEADQPLDIVEFAAESTPEASGEEAGEAESQPVESGDVQSQPVESRVEEVEYSLGGDDEASDDAPQEPVPEVAVDDTVDVFEQWDPKDCIIHCPDVCDDVIRNQVTPSPRVYPEPLVWPLKDLEPLTNITSHVGWRDAGRIQRRQGGTWASWLHHGIDVGGVDTSQPVVAAADGLAYSGSCDGLGNYVVIDHQNGWYTRYQHMSAFAGDITVDCRAVPVHAGDEIGYVGGTGGDYPVHLHFEIAWSPAGPGADDRTYQIETNNRKIHAYSFPQQKTIRLRWADTWEICTAENQNFLPLPQPGDGEAMPDGE